MNKETCNEHIFGTDGSIHNNPTNCIKCGKSARQWEKEILEKANMKKEIKEKIIEILNPILNQSWEYEATHEKVEEFADQILELFETEWQNWVKEIIEMAEGMKEEYRGSLLSFEQDHNINFEQLVNAYNQGIQDLISKLQDLITTLKDNK